ncbi:MAG: metalloregulator ArsR/SmtB family transcription factor [Solirubrobacterales bacterium]
MTLEAASKRHTEEPVVRSGAPGREPLSTELVELTALRLRVIADPTRIALLEALNEGEGAVCELADRTGLSHQTTSHHLLVLHQAGIVARQREGKLARYGMADWSAWWVVEQIARSAEPSLTEVA